MPGTWISTADAASTIDLIRACPCADQQVRSRIEGPVFLCPSGRGWRVENLSRTYSRLRDQARLGQTSTFNFSLDPGAPGFNALLSRAALHLDDQELAESRDLAD
jgi:hypothetical protein